VVEEAGAAEPEMILGITEAGAAEPEMTLVIMIVVTVVEAGGVSMMMITTEEAVGVADLVAVTVMITSEGGSARSCQGGYLWSGFEAIAGDAWALGDA